MNKTTAIKFAAKLYWLVSIAGSFTHVQHACVMLGANSWERWVAPAMVDGMFLIAMLMRSEDWVRRTQRIGFWLMVAMGSISLAGNVYAASSLFGFIFGVFLPLAMLLGEWLSDRKQLVTAKEQADKEAVAEAERIARESNAWLDACTHPTRCKSESQCSSKTQAAKTRQSKVRKGKRQVKVLEDMLAA